MINRRTSQLARLLGRVRNFVTVDPGPNGVLRRSLDSPNESEVQLELDFGRGGGAKGLASLGRGSFRVTH